MTAGSARRPFVGAVSLNPRGIDELRPRERATADMGGVRTSTLGAAPRPLALSSAQQVQFHALYRDHFDFVFRNLRRLGVPPGATDDALQEVYLVVLRRLPELREDSSPKAWLFAIAVRVASTFRRTQRRRGDVIPLLESVIDRAAPSPFELTARAEARRVLHAFLDTLSEGSRAIFIMSELEQMTAPEISHSLGMNVNTIYGRLAVARAELARVVASAARRDAGTKDGGGSHG